MRRRTLIAFAAAALAVATSVMVRAGGEHDMEAWARAMTPGEPHAELTRQAGEWSYVVTIWSEPGAEPTTLEGVAIKTMIMGGRYLQEELSGEFMDRPFRGFGVTGYDNVTKKSVAIWFDNMSTGINYYTGRTNPDGTQTFRSEVHDPATGRAIATRSVGKVIDDDHHTYESYMRLPDGGEFLHMRVEYTRVGA